VLFPHARHLLGQFLDSPSHFALPTCICNFEFNKVNPIPKYFVSSVALFYNNTRFACHANCKAYSAPQDPSQVSRRRPSKPDGLPVFCCKINEPFCLDKITIFSRRSYPKPPTGGESRATPLPNLQHLSPYGLRRLIGGQCTANCESWDA